MLEAMAQTADRYSLAVAIAVVGLTMAISNVASRRLTGGRIHGSAIAIALALFGAAIGGVVTGGSNGLADVTALSGLAIFGGAAFRDMAIVATAWGVRLEAFLSLGWRGVASLLVGVVHSFSIGGLIAFALGYRDPIDITTIGGGAATYIVGPLTGEALGASPEVIAVSFAAGLIKSVACMIVTPLVANRIGLDNPRSALVFGGLMGTTSGVAAGLAATDPALAPYGAMTATFFTGVGCLLGPSLMYAIAVAIF